jgi:endonuclease/exonuclease/phosphatase family metal-dependent hydrolase
VYQGFDAYTAPGIQGLAAVIEAANADLISLEEIPRGDNLSGGHDLAAWLHWRFPQYQVVYGPQDGDMMDIMVMSRYPIHTWGTERYRLASPNSINGQASPPRGLIWATIPTQSGDLLFVSTHLPPYSRFTADRIAEADALTKLWNRRERTIIAGDFNAGPEDQAIKHLLAAGLNDVPAAHGLGSTFTYPALEPKERIDYIFSSPDVQSVSAQVTLTLASDHLPIQATIRLK